MIKTFSLLFLSIGILVGIHYPVATAQFDEVIPSICNTQTENSTACNEIERGVNEANPVTSTTQNVVNLLSLATAAIAVVVIIIAGITMTLSQGDAGKVKSSRDAIIYAAVGLVVAALARAIVFFIVNRTR